MKTAPKTATLYNRDWQPIYTFTEGESLLNLPLGHPVARMILDAEIPDFWVRLEDGRTGRLSQWELRKAHEGNCPDCACERELRIEWRNANEALR